MEIYNSSVSFLVYVEECISEKESMRFEKKLNTKSDNYKQFGNIVEFKKYLHGVCDDGK